MNNLSVRWRIVVVCWIAALSYCLPAAAEVLGAASLAAGIKGFDYESLIWGVIVAVVGGGSRTIITFISRRVIVIDMLKEARWDLIISAFAGLFASLMLQAAAEYVTIAVPLQIVILVFCGWARMGFFNWVERRGETIADKSADWIEGQIASIEPKKHDERKENP